MKRNHETSQIMIIGAMKSGTTNLFRSLAQHSKICPCEVKEPRFFLQSRLREKAQRLFGFI
jgi:tRNA A37 threonylcarbamoyladenosine biosynthesis protein TsaE